MPVFWHYFSTITSAASPTVTVVETTTETLLNVNAHAKNHSGSIWADDNRELLYENLRPYFHIFLIVVVPIIWWLARWRKVVLEERKLEEEAFLEAWREPWLINDWEVLFGLMGLANDHQWTHTPFHAYPSVYKAWHQHNRPWQKRLLAMGIIPLAIHDGGVETYRVKYHGFGFKKWFLYVKWPTYLQGKRRACFEFLIPHPNHDEKRKRFLESIIENRKSSSAEHSYGVAVRYSPPDQGQIFYSLLNPPPTQGKPFEVGAQSALEPLLPFKRDKVIKRGYGERCNSLTFYMREFDPSRVPLLQKSDTILVRIEAKHFGEEQLDRFVFHLGQDADLDVEWVESHAREAALLELESCGLPRDGLRPFALSVPDRYR